MSKSQFVTSLALHACPDEAIAKTDGVLLQFGIRPVWSQQPLIQKTSRAEYSIKLSQTMADDLVSELNALANIHFELTQTVGAIGILFMSVPGLGIYRGELNSAGALMLSEDQINSLVTNSAGNQREFMRLLRLALGQSWDDILEPMRAIKYGDNVLLLNRAG